MSLPAAWITPDWPAPATVRALSTTRAGGASLGPHAGFNLGAHCGDAPAAVAANRAALQAALGLPRPPRYLRQVHGRGVARVEACGDDVEADAAVARRPGDAALVMTADCLPVLLCDRAGSVVGAAHGGWRGLADGVLAATVAAMDVAPASIIAWMGPAIGPQAFEVGDEVRAAFVTQDGAHAAAFRPSPGGRWLADIYALARRQLQALGVAGVYGGGLCTVSDPARFYSYRRDGGLTGRMASLVWITPAG